MAWFKRNSLPEVHVRSVGVPDDRFFAGTKFILPEGDDTAASRVTPDTAMKFSAVYACVKVISETLASLPLIVYKRRADGGKDRASENPLYRILRNAPNPMKMTGMEFRELLTANVLLWGNGYAQIVRNGRGEVIGLYPLHPANVQPQYKKEKQKPEDTEYTVSVEYRVQVQGGPARILPSKEVFHLKGLCTNNPLIGQSPVSAMRQAISMGMTLENYAANFFDGGAFPAGVLEYEGALEEQAKENLRSSWQKLFGGKNRGKNTAVLEMGVKWKGMGIPQTDAQFLETRRMQIEEIGRAFRVPLHLIGDLSRATFSNIEAQGGEFITYCMMPWFRRWEEAILRDLVSEDEQEEVFAEFLLDGLLRGDTAARFGAYAVGIQNGFLTRNEVRLRENLNPKDGADELLLPMNMANADSQTKQSETPAIPAEGAKKAFKSVFLEGFRRILSKEVNAVRAAHKKHSAEDFARWYADFRVAHAVFAENCLKTSFSAYSELIGRSETLDLEPYLAEMDRFVKAYRADPVGEYERGSEAAEYRTKRLIDYSGDYGIAA